MNHPPGPQTQRIRLSGRPAAPGLRVSMVRQGSPARPAAAAFTLVELLIGMALALMVMTAMLSTYTYLGRSLARLVNQQTLETQARRTLGYFTQDVQRATDITATTAGVTAPDFYVTFTVPRTPAGVTQVIYYYSRDGASRSIAGNNITIPAHSLVRFESTGSSIAGPIQTVLGSILATNDGCYLRFFDASGNPFDNGTAPYTPDFSASSAKGVKQVSLGFSTQTGSSFNGTRTAVQQVASARLLLRNHSLLQ